ncbi:MAG: MBL fold metallo-hydrolase [Lentisphaerae bacterium]|nr:MBL fold metallo-hydrolase [Lentisphaerota bacterium]
MKLHVLGALSGTEPFKDLHHTSWVVELENGHLYWFDAGENCSHTAYLMGLDLFNIQALFISHPHYDHMAGLLNVFSTYAKMHYLVAVDADTERSFDLYMPVAGLWETFESLTRQLRAYPPATTVRPHVACDGGCFENDEIKIEFRGNMHMPLTEDGKHQAFSFRISAEGKTVVASGDCKSPDEFLDWSKNCDLQLMESGHHHPWEVCRFWKEQQCNINKILFMHHGRDVLYLPTESKIRSQRAWGKEVLFARNGMTIEV